MKTEEQEGNSEPDVLSGFFLKIFKNNKKNDNPHMISSLNSEEVSPSFKFNKINPPNSNFFFNILLFSLYFTAINSRPFFAGCGRERATLLPSAVISDSLKEWYMVHRGHIDLSQSLATYNSQAASITAGLHCFCVSFL